MPDVPWNGPITREGVWTGDGRFFEPGALVWADPPMPLEWVRESTDVPHGNKVIVGAIDTLERMTGDEGNVLHGTGRVFESPEQDEVLRLLEEGVVGPSVDLDGPFEVEVEMQMPSEDDFEPSENDDGEEVVTMSVTQDKVRFFQATVRGATLVSTPAFLDLRLAVERVEQPVEASATVDALSLVAANMPAPPMTPPVEWFRDPHLDGATPITVTDEGRVFGHIAVWGDCHTAYDVCVSPPRSANAYAYFLTGEILCDEGERIPVGQITVATGHAPIRLGAKAAASHYDNTGAAAVDIAVGEDQFGVWCAGALRPGVTDEQVRALMCSDVSGDWRPLRGGLELIGVLAVNVPGFPKSRVAARVASGNVEIEALVASAGPVRVRLDAPEFDAHRIAERIAATVGHDAWQADRMQAARDRLVALKG